MDGESCPLILHENAVCFLVERPAVCPLVSQTPFASEGFLAWFLRRFSPDSDVAACRSVLLAGRELILIPKGQRRNAASFPPLQCEPEHSARAGGALPGGWRVTHPQLESAVFVNAGLLPDEKHCPQWLDSAETNAYRCGRFALDAGVVCSVDRLGDYFLGQFEEPPGEAALAQLTNFFQKAGGKGCYWRVLSREAPGSATSALCPRLLAGPQVGADCRIRESGVVYRVDFFVGHSFGLFLDQRENRFRFLQNLVSPGFPVFLAAGRKPPLVLNAFAYTCGFSVCAGLAGAKVSSVDLSRKHLHWGERNFALNRLNPTEHEFLAGDVFGWIKRFQRRGRQFDAIVLDPPTFSRSKEGGVFKVEQDLPRLAKMAASLLTAGGRLLVSSNKTSWPPGRFTRSIETAIQRAGRKIGKRCFATQPWDFGLTTGESAGMKSWWFEIW